MLQSIRDRLTGWLVWFVVGLIIIPFAFWGIESFRTGGGDPVVVKVGDQEITQSQFRAAYEQRYQQFQAMMGERFRADQFDQTRFRQAVLDDMTQEAMLRQFVRKSGYRADDAALFKTISAIPAFQDKGQFSADAYKAALSSKGLTPQRFEAQLRDSVEIDQVRENVLGSAFITANAAAQAYALANQQRDLSYAIFDNAKYAATISITDAQIKARYDADQAKYMAPERVKLAYVELSADSLPKAEAPSKDALQVIYNAEKDARFTTPEERKVSHILVNFGADKAAAKKKAEDLLAKIKAGANFADVAKSSSDDSGSKAQGGALGWIKRGQMPEKFEQPLFALTKAGEIAGPVETEFGWHLIKLDELKPVKVRPFDDATVQAEILELYRTRESQRRLQEETDKLEQLAFENPASLDAVVKALNLPLQTTDWFTRAGGPGIAANDAVKQAAFSKEIVVDGDNSKPIALAAGKVIVIRKADYEAPRQKKLEEVIDQVRASVLADAAKAKAMTEAQQMAAAARAGRPLAELAAARGVSLKTPGLIRRDNTTEDRTLVDALFRLPRPKAGDVSAADIALPNGNVAVVALSQVKDAEAPAANAAGMEQVHAQLQDATAGAEFADYRKWIEGQIKVKIENPPSSDSASSPQS